MVDALVFQTSGLVPYGFESHRRHAEETLYEVYPPKVQTMDPNRVQELATLLDDALNNVVIKRRSTSEYMDIRVYQHYLNQVRISHNFDLSFIFSIYEPSIENAVIKGKICELITEELSEHIQDGRIQSAIYGIHGGMTNGYPLEDYLGKLLDLAMIHGSQPTAYEFLMCVNNQSGTYKGFSMLSGLSLESDLPIFDGIRLDKLPTSTSEPPPFFPKSFSNVFPNFQPADFSRKAIIAIDHSISPAFLKPFPPSFEMNPFNKTIASTDAPDFNLGLFCQALSLTCNVSVRPIMSWIHVGEDAIFVPRGPIGGGMSYNSQGFNDRSSVAVTETEITEAKDLYRNMLQLSAQTHDSLQIPIDRWIKSKGPASYVDKMIDLGIALESLYLGGIKGAEVRFRFSLRASWHLSETRNERIDMMKTFKQIYDQRSNAVHTGVLPEEVTVDGARIPTYEFVTQAQDLCAMSLKKVINDGQLPDWDTLILG